MKPDSTKCQLLVEMFLQGQKIVWPRQIPIAKKLIAFCDDLSFWLKIKNNLKMEVFSLNLFLSEFMMKKLESEKKLFFLDKVEKKSYTLETEKISEDVEKTKKIKTLKDFLKNG